MSHLETLFSSPELAWYIILYRIIRFIIHLAIPSQILLNSPHLSRHLHKRQLSNLRLLIAYLGWIEFLLRMNDELFWILIHLKTSYTVKWSRTLGFLLIPCMSRPGVLYYINIYFHDSKVNKPSGVPSSTCMYICDWSCRIKYFELESRGRDTTNKHGLWNREYLICTSAHIHI